MNTIAGVATLCAAYDATITKKFTLSRTGASAFNLRIASATGIDKQALIFPTLGYDSSADKTGAAADAGYESDYEVLKISAGFKSMQAAPGKTTRFTTMMDPPGPQQLRPANTISNLCFLK